MFVYRVTITVYNTDCVLYTIASPLPLATNTFTFASAQIAPALLYGYRLAVCFTVTFLLSFTITFPLSFSVTFNYHPHRINNLKIEQAIQLRTKKILIVQLFFGGEQKRGDPIFNLPTDSGPLDLGKVQVRN